MRWSRSATEPNTGYRPDAAAGPMQAKPQHGGRQTLSPVCICAPHLPVPRDTAGPEQAAQKQKPQPLTQRLRFRQQDRNARSSETPPCPGGAFTVTNAGSRQDPVPGAVLYQAGAAFPATVALALPFAAAPVLFFKELLEVTGTEHSTSPIRCGGPDHPAPCD